MESSAVAHSHNCWLRKTNRKVAHLLVETIEKFGGTDGTEKLLEIV